MSVVPSLLQAIVKVDGEAMVIHAGDKPYVVSPTGQIELASRGLTLEAVNGIVGQLLPRELQTALEEFGAVQYELPAVPEFPGEHFTTVAARGGDDVWVEIRRRRVAEDDRVPDEFFAAAASSQPAPPPPPMTPPPPPPSVLKHVAPAPAPAHPLAPPRPATSHDEIDDEIPLDMFAPVVARTPQPEPARAQSAPARPERQQPAPAPPARAQSAPAAPTRPQPPPAPPARAQSAPALPERQQPSSAPPARAQSTPAQPTRPQPASAPPARPQPPPAPRVLERAATESVTELEVDIDVDVEPDVELPPATYWQPPPPEPPQPAAAAPDPQPSRMTAAPPVAAAPQPRATAPPPAAIAPPPREAAAPPPPAPPRAVAPAPPQPAVVLPIARSPIRTEQPLPSVGDPTLSGLERLLRLSSARGASTLYLSSDSRPSVRVDGELQMLDGEAVHAARDVESLLLTLMPERSHEALRTGGATEWISDIEGIGRVRCMSFRDHRGPGGVFRLMPTRSISADQLGLPRQVQSLAIEPEGLVLVAGPRSSGKRTLMSAFVDLMNRTRRDHIITIEREINIVHDRGHSFISQREVRGGDDDMVAAARGAMREDPDVLVIEDLRTGPLMNVALEAAAAGRLVIGGFSAHTAAGAIDRIIDLYAPEYRRPVQMAIADSLRGVIVQVLLRKIGGGRVPAREVLLNTPAVSAAIAEGKTSQLPMAIEGGRRYGMMPLNDALVGLVQTGVVEARDAYRQSTDRPGYLAALNRHGIDTSFVERLA